MEFQHGICTLCLEQHENCEAIEGDTKNVLCILMPKIDFTMIHGPIICRNCAETLIKCFDFKTRCLHTHNSIVPFVDENEKVDVNDIHTSKSKIVVGTCVPEDQDICGFCMSLIKNVSAVSLAVEEGDVMLENMIKHCLPELDLSFVKKLVICAPCLGSLENCFHFMTNCLIAEDKIKKYCETLNINSKDEIDLASVLKFTIGNTKRGVDGNLVSRIKVEQQFCEDTKSPDETEIDDRRYKFKLEEIFFDDCVHANEHVKIKNESFMEVVDQKVNNEQFTLKNMFVFKEESNKLDFIKIEELFCEENDTKHKEQDLFKMEDQKCPLNEEIEIKADGHDYDGFKNSTVLSQPEAATRLQRKQKCLIFDLEGDKMTPYIEETVANRNASAIAMYKCNSCLYQTKYKTDLERHLLKHKDPSEVSMYKCKSCLYQTKYKTDLERHLLKHKDPSEVTMYNCKSCLYQTKSKMYLKRHLLRHKDPLEVTMYKCEHCLFQTKHKDSLKKHLLNHKDPSEVTMYKCDSCLYQTRFKGDLKNHLLRHKSPSEVTMYKCNFCLHQTKHKYVLARHLLTHKDPSELTMYKCDTCLYQTLYKNHFKTHLLKHKDVSEVTMYRCGTCSFQTKYKQQLQRHLLKHKDLSERTIYKCEFCLHQTTRKDCLNIHLLRHKDPSEVTMYKCDLCSYQAKYKKYLKRHLVINHKNPCK